MDGLKIKEMVLVTAEVDSEIVFHYYRSYGAIKLESRSALALSPKPPIKGIYT